MSFTNFDELHVYAILNVGVNFDRSLTNMFGVYVLM